MARVPNKYLVEGGERARVVGGRPHHGQLVHPQVAARVDTTEGRDPLVGSASDEYAGVRLRDRVDADHGLVARILGDVGDQTVGSHDDDDVLGGEEEARQGITLDVGARPPIRDARTHASQGSHVRLVRTLDGLEGAPAAAQDEFDLASRGVAVHELVELGGASDDDGAAAHDYCPAFAEPVKAATRSLSTSAVMVMFPKDGMFFAISFSARARATSGPASASAWM